jgi:hypothetical protein
MLPLKKFFQETDDVRARSESETKSYIILAI